MRLAVGLKQWSNRDVVVPDPAEGLWGRIFRHKVVEWTLVYAAAAFSLLNGVEMVSAALDWSHFIARAVALVLLLGLPIATTLAWFHGHRSQTRVAGSELIILTVLLVLAGGVLWYLGRPTHEQTPTNTTSLAPASAVVSPAAITRPPEKSVAVLPFVDISEKKDQEYLSDGMTEELLNLLARVPGLYVPARTSSFYFKGRSDDIPTIARRLMVAQVLEGSVRRSGNRVRVSVELVRADNGYQIWSESYDRPLNDIFKIQNEIAHEVIKALEISLGANEVPRAAAVNDTQAHTLLLKARFLLYHARFLSYQTDYHCKIAVGYLQQAVQLDPDFAAAWAELPHALRCENEYSEHQPWQEVGALALQAAERAVALDPKLPKAHYAVAEIRYWYYWDWAAADAEYRTACALDPAYSDALMGAGMVAATRGHMGNALRLFQQAVAKDPLNHWAYINLVTAYDVMGRLTEAEAAARKALELAPTSAVVHGLLGGVLLDQGHHAAALAEIDQEVDPGFRLGGQAGAYFLMGRKADSDAALARLEKAANTGTTQLYNIATLHAVRGETDQAFAWLERAYQSHDRTIVGIPPITTDPNMNNLRGDPRFKAFMRKINLPQ